MAQANTKNVEKSHSLASTFSFSNLIGNQLVVARL